MALLSRWGFLHWFISVPDGWVMEGSPASSGKSKGTASALRPKRGADRRNVVEEHRKAAERLASLRCSSPGREGLRSVGNEKESRLDGSLGERSGGGVRVEPTDRMALALRPNDAARLEREALSLRSVMAVFPNPAGLVFIIRRQAIGKFGYFIDMRYQFVSELS